MTNVNAASGADQTNLYAEVKEEMGSSVRAGQFGSQHPDLNAEIENASSAFDDRIADLQQQLSDTGDPTQKLKLEQEIGSLEMAADAFRDGIDGAFDELSSLTHFGVTGLANFDEDFLTEIKGLLSDFRQTVVDSYDNFGTCGVQPNGALEEAKKPRVDPEDVRGIQKSTGSGETEGASEADSAGEAGEVDSADGASADGADHSTDELVDALQNDPDAFQDMMADMDAEDRQTAMMAVQNQLQQINQTFQMMSQFSQAMHDTQKAIIQNMRV